MMRGIITIVVWAAGWSLLADSVIYPHLSWAAWAVAALPFFVALVLGFRELVRWLEGLWP